MENIDFPYVTEESVEQVQVDLNLDEIRALSLDEIRKKLAEEQGE